MVATLERKGVSLNPQDFLDEPETKAERKEFWEPLIVLPRAEAVAELDKIDGRIEVIKARMEKGGLPLAEWQRLGKEWGGLLRKSGSIGFGSMPESYCP